MEDVAKLAIVVGTQGVKESSKEMKELTDRVKELETQLKKKKKTTGETEKQQRKFTTAMGEFRRNLPEVASGVYLVRQAYQALSGAINNVEEAYEAQYSSEIKLNTLLQTTNHAIRMTAQEVYNLTAAWSDQTGINDALLNEVAAIGATFTQLSDGIFPRLMEQAINMSTIFGQDLKQSMIQLGIATNNLQYGRLTRVGISFTEQQKKQITAHREAGEIMEGQMLIMAELEAEIGQVAKAMGESSLGAIKKYKNAWVDLKEELGETSTTLKAELLEALNITQTLSTMTEALSEKNTGKKFTQLIDSGAINEDLMLATTNLNEISEAYTFFAEKQSHAAKILRTGIKLGSTGDELEALKNTLSKWENYVNSMQGLSERYRQYQIDLKGGFGEDEDVTPEDTKGLDAFLAKLEELRRKSEMSGMTEYKKQVTELNYAWTDLAVTADSFGLTEETLRAKTGEYFDVMQAALNEQIQLETMLLLKKQQRAEAEETLNALSGVTDLTTQNLINSREKLGEMYQQGTIGIEEYLTSLEKLKALEDALPQDNSFLEGLIGGFDTATERAKLFEATMQDIGQQVQGIGVDVLTQSLDQLGRSFAGLKGEDETWEQMMIKMVASSLSAVGPNLMLAGALALAEPGGWRNPVGWALLAAGGAASVGGGYLSQEISNAEGETSSNGVTSSTAINTSTVDFGDSSGSGRGVSPNIQTNIINNNGSEVTANATVGNDGQILLETVIDSAVTATGNTYGLQRPGRNVR